MNHKPKLCWKFNKEFIQLTEMERDRMFLNETHKNDRIEYKKKTRIQFTFGFLCDCVCSINCNGNQLWFTLNIEFITTDSLDWMNMVTFLEEEKRSWAHTKMKISLLSKKYVLFQNKKKGMTQNIAYVCLYMMRIIQKSCHLNWL